MATKKSASAGLVGRMRKWAVPLLVATALIAYAFGGRLGSSDASAAAIPIEDLQSPPTDARQLIVVSAPSLGTNQATLQAFEREGTGWRSVFGPMDAHIGRNGFRADRKEGDGTTPTGTYTLTESFGIQPNPGTHLPYRVVGPNDYWVNDSGQPTIYNTWQTFTGGKPPWTAEHLIDFGRSYNHAVVIDFNRGADRVVGRGSAIFLHVDNGKPTSGCVSVDQAQLVKIMGWLDAAKRPTIMMGTEALLLKIKDAPPVTPGPSGGLRPLAPTRVLDTRIGLGATGPVPAQSTIDLPLAGAVAGVPRDAVAVALNLTITEQTEQTYLTVYPAPANDTEGPPLVSNVNAAPGEHRANLVWVRLGDAGRVRIYNLTGRSQVVADLVGYVAPSVIGRFQPVTPYRVLDTRYGTGRPGTAKLGANENLDVPVALAPADATAAVVNVTVADPTKDTYLAAFMGAMAWQDTSTVNTKAFETSANLAIVPINPQDRTIRIRNANGDSDVVVDVQGFVTPTGSRFTAAETPVRVLDTRAGIGSRGRLAAGSLLSVAIHGLPADATAVAVTVTAVDASKTAFVRATGAGDTASQSSNLNVRAGDTRANLAIVPIGADGRVNLTVNDGDVDLVVDVSGWFAPG